MHRCHWDCWLSEWPSALVAFDGTLHEHCQSEVSQLTNGQSKEYEKERKTK